MTFSTVGFKVVSSMQALLLKLNKDRLKINFFGAYFSTQKNKYL